MSNSMRSRLLKVFFVLVVCLLAAGCYSVSREVIPTDLGEVLPYSSDYADLEGGGKIYFSKVAFSNDYRFRKEGTKDADMEDAESQTGTFRIMRVQNDIYAVQERDDGDESYSILFYQITANNFHSMEVEPGTNLVALASRYHVKLDGDDELSGSASDMLAFLKAHRDVKFVSK